MTQIPSSLGNSAEAEKVLRPAALWAAACAGLALAIFEGKQPRDTRPRDAIKAGEAFGRGSPRDRMLRTLAWAAQSAAKESGSEAAKYAARSAMLAAAVAYTHTDVNIGKQGVGQARHLLGPAVYAALACEVATQKQAGVADGVLQTAANTAPQEVGILLQHFPRQPQGTTRLSQLFYDLDTRLRLLL